MGVRRRVEDVQLTGQSIPLRGFKLSMDQRCIPGVRPFLRPAAIRFAASAPCYAPGCWTPCSGCSQCPPRLLRGWLTT